MTTPREAVAHQFCISKDLSNPPCDRCQDIARRAIEALREGAEERLIRYFGERFLPEDYPEIVEVILGPKEGE